MSVRLDLTEPLAYGLAQAAIFLVLKDRSRWAAIVLAIAALTKEMTLLCVAAVAVRYVVQRSWRKLIELSVIAGGPFVMWQLLLLNRFGQLGIGSGGAMATPFEIVPLRGLWSIAFADGRVFLLIAAITLPMAVIPALIAVWQIGRDVQRRRFDLSMLLLFFNAIVVLFIPQSTFREPLAMARFIVGLIAAAVMYAAARRSARGLRYAQLWIFTLGLALNETQLPI